MAASLADSEPSLQLRVALIGNPNTGKSSVFNMLVGMRAHVGNYPGVTVEKKIGHVRWGNRRVELIDLPGAYSLSARTPDEMVSVDVLLGRQSEVRDIDVIVCVVDASNLERNLYLVSQLLELCRPLVLVLNMWDVAERRKIAIDTAQLEAMTGARVVTTEARRQRGHDALRDAIVAAAGQQPPSAPTLFSADFHAACDHVRGQLEAAGIERPPRYFVERLVLDEGGRIEQSLPPTTATQVADAVKAARDRLRNHDEPIATVEASVRYKWSRGVMQAVFTSDAAQSTDTITTRMDRVLTHSFAGVVLFAIAMFVVFQSIYSWAGPITSVFEMSQEWLSDLVCRIVAPGPLRSLLKDGVVAGVGGVLVFLPQIVLLFFFIALMEDCGYMARAAFLMDRLMAKIGLSGRAFLPLMSSFACAVPGIMATRVIENHRDRMITILIAPLMSCSARLPVYLLLIAAFIPQHTWLGGWISLHALVLFAMSSLGVVVAIPVAWLLKRTFFRGDPPPFVMEMPDFKLPSVRVVTHRVYDRAKAFVLRAGSLIFATTILVWAAGYFPADHGRLHQLESQIEELDSVAEQTVGESDRPVDTRRASLVAERNLESGRLIQASFLGRTGQAIEPLVKPLGWDWRIGVGVIASFPAREVIISTLGTIYSLGGDVDEDSSGLRDALRSSKWPDGSRVYSVPVAISIMVFFALCAQCASTLMVIRRETNSWVWPLFSFSYMTALAWIGAWLAWRIGSLWF